MQRSDFAVFDSALDDMGIIALDIKSARSAELAEPGWLTIYTMWTWRKRKPIPLQQNQTAELRRKTIVLPSLGLRRPLPPPQAHRYPTISSVMRRRRRSNSVWPGLW